MYLKKNNNNLKIHRSSSNLCTQSICLRILKGMRPDLVETPVTFEFSFIRLVFKGIRPDLVETLVSFKFSFIRLVFVFKSFFSFSYHTGNSDNDFFGVNSFYTNKNSTVEPR